MLTMEKRLEHALDRLEAVIAQLEQSGVAASHGESHDNSAEIAEIRSMISEAMSLLGNEASS